MNEEWKEVYFKGVYTGRKISNLGRMMFDDGSFAKLSDNGAGYLSYGVCNYKNDEGEWKAKREYAHRLVAQHFLPNPNNLPQVNHKDCDKSNNAVSNLEWCKRGDNIDHAHAMGRMKKRTENADINILTVEQVIELYTSVKRDGIGISTMARYLNIPRTTASSIMNKRSRGAITNAIDDYLNLEDIVTDRMLTVLDLGLREDDNYITRPNRKKKDHYETEQKLGLL